MTENETSSFDAFCGGPLWDANLTWYTSQPDVTPCFLKTVCVWTVSGVIGVVSPLYAAYLCTRHSDIRSYTRLYGAKQVLCVLLFVLAVTALIHVTVTSDHRAPADTLATLLLLLDTMCVFLLHEAERRKGFVTSGVLWTFWGIAVFTGLLPCYSLSLRASQGTLPVDGLLVTVVFFVAFGLTVLQFLLASFAEVLPSKPYSPGGREMCPEVNASFPSRMTFWWMNSLVMRGYRKTLQEDDLWALHPRDLVDNTYPQLARAWQREVATQSQRLHVNKCVPVKTGSAEGEKTPLLSAEYTSQAYTQPQVQESKAPSPSLTRALIRVFGPDLAIQWLFKLIADVLIFAGPIIQSWLIAFTEDLAMEEWKGYVYAVLIFATLVLISFIYTMPYHIGYYTGMRIRSSVIAAVYKKSLTLSMEARKTSTAGEIVNLMSVDAQRLQDCAPYLYMALSAPVQISIAIYLIWVRLGPSVFAGLSVMLLLIPLNAYLATLQRKLQVDQMKKKDSRVKLMNEVLNGIKVLKMYAWEPSFREKIAAIRDDELSLLRKYSYVGAAAAFTWSCAPFLVTFVSFAVFVSVGGVLDATTAFTSLSLFDILRMPINMLPMIIAYVVTASVSVKRLSRFLSEADVDLTNVQHDEHAADAVAIHDGEFSWGSGSEDPIVLKDVELCVQPGQLVAVVGQVGSGKSSLLSTMIGDMHKLKGRVNVKGSLAYVAQQAWIQNSTLRDNVTFSSELDLQKYDEIIEACALKADLDILPGGDQTEIGEKGINLSGGQKARVSLARAIYQDADVYLLDDPLSAVDAHVGKHIFEKVISNSTGLLRNKTRILVTHSLQCLPACDVVVVVSEGRLSEVGTCDELLAHDGPFAHFLATHLHQQDSDDSDGDSDAEARQLKHDLLRRAESVVKDTGGTELKGSAVSDSDKKAVGDDHPSSNKSSTSKISRKSRKSSRKLKTQASTVPAVKGQTLIEQEKAEVGTVKWSVFWSYIVALGACNATWLFAAYILFQVSSVGANVWLSFWTDDPLFKNVSVAVNSTAYTERTNMYLGGYGGFGVAQVCFVLMHSLISAVSMVRAAGYFHEGMLGNVLQSPMAFFDTTPIGRILNRFSRDIETIDNLIPQMLRAGINMLLGVLSVLIIISYSTPVFLAAVVPLVVLYFLIQRFYIPTSRQLKRIEATTRSPIYSHFSETISGVSTIRAYGVQQRFIERSRDLIDHNQIFYYNNVASNRWIGQRLEFLGALVVLAAALFAVIGRSTLSGSVVGLSISYALQITQTLNWLVRIASELESNIVSVERVIEYSETPREAPWHVSRGAPRPSWPADGELHMAEYSTRYRPGLDLVLKGINLRIAPGEKIGVVGRTGAGKSSIALAMFRIIEAAQGEIRIDDVSIAGLGLHQLRRRLAILPQDPVLFADTLRANLDPMDEHSDEALWDALQHAHLRVFVSSLPTRLDYLVGEGGQNLSVGQRQLVCLARVLLRQAKVLILDEATAAVDMETDELIQATIREQLRDCTVITIAHRIHTVLESDRVLVLDQGKVAEFGATDELLRDPKSLLSSLAHEAGIGRDGRRRTGSAMLGRPKGEGQHTGGGGELQTQSVDSV